MTNTIASCVRARRLAATMLVAGMAVASLSCDDPSPTGVGVVQASAQRNAGKHRGRNQGMVACAPLPYDSVTVTVGRSGGVIRVGPHELWISTGALRAPVSITAVIRPDTINVVQLEPHGLTFAAPISLNLSYANCNVAGSPHRVRVAYVSDSLEVISFVPSYDRRWNSRVSGTLEHFSNYALSW